MRTAGRVVNYNFRMLLCLKHSSACIDKVRCKIEITEYVVTHNLNAINTSFKRSIEAIDFPNFSSVGYLR